MSHLGDRLSAVVDGELGHAERDLVLAHLARCDSCRELVEVERAVKARLVGLAPPPLPPSLVARLQHISAPPLAVAPTGAESASADDARLPARRLRRATRRPSGRPLAPGRARRRTASAGAFVVVGLSTAFVLGGQDAGGEAPVRPAVERFSIEHASVTGTVPLVDPASLVGAGGRR